METTISLRLRPCCTEFLVFFPYFDEAIRSTLNTVGIHYKPTARGYTVSAEPEVMERVKATCQQQGLTLIMPPDLGPELLIPTVQDALLTQYCQCLTQEHYNSQTIKNYRTAFSLFLDYHASRLPFELAKQDILDYLAKRNEAGISKTYQNLLVNAIKIYYHKVEGQTDFDIPRPKRPQLNPKFLSRQEVKALLQGTENLKHRAMMMLAYGIGLRLSEVLALTIPDIDSQRMLLCVRGGKGKRDRYLPLPNALLLLLREQIQQCRPLIFLFEGVYPGKPYSARSLQQVVNQAANRAGMKRPVTIHMLRHSYATHLLEAGTEIHLLQDLLGHTSIKSTSIYTQTIRRPNIYSPLDDLLI